MLPDSYSATVVLETERLLLSTWQPSDWIAFRPIAIDVQVMRYITGGVPWTDECIQSFVNRQVELFSDRGFCRWKLLLKPALEMIGFCGVGFWGDDLEPEIGWWLARQYWRLMSSYRDVMCMTLCAALWPRLGDGSCPCCAPGCF